MRIASLVPSATETLFALGLGPHVVARTGFCIHPAAGVTGVAKVGGTKDVNLDKLRRLAPTHVVLNVDENLRETAEALADFVPHLVVTHPRRVEDNEALFQQLGGAFGVPDRAAQLTARMRAVLEQARRKTWPPQRVLYLIWRDPWMTVARDTWIASMLAEVGWQSWPPVEGGESGAARYPALRGDEPWLREIDEVLLSSEPYRFGPEHLADAQTLCPQARVRLVDGEAVSWWGMRAIEGLQALMSWAEADRTMA
jgi:ABC-type Fe3+-hydroxamate transport system substrate-binding protein